jgi:hypothetical protein
MTADYIVYSVAAIVACASWCVSWSITRTNRTAKKARPSDTLTIGIELDAKDATKSIHELSDAAASLKAIIGDVDARVRVMSPKAGDVIVVSAGQYLTAEQCELIGAALKAELPEGVKAMIPEGVLALTHIESPGAANERHELLCEVKAIREEMRQHRERVEACGMPIRSA